MYKEDSVVISSSIVLFIHTQHGNTPLHEAARWGDLDTVKDLIKCGAEVLENKVSIMT